MESIKALRLKIIPSGGSKAPHQSINYKIFRTKNGDEEGVEDGEEEEEEEDEVVAQDCSMNHFPGRGCGEKYWQYQLGGREPEKFEVERNLVCSIFVASSPLTFFVVCCDRSTLLIKFVETLCGSLLLAVLLNQSNRCYPHSQGQIIVLVPKSVF